MLKILFFLFSLTPIFSFAQVVKDFGIKAGLSISQQDWDEGIVEYFNIDDKVGVNISVFGEFFNHPRHSLIAELSYIQKGAKSSYLESRITNDVYEDGISNWAISLDYLSLSILGKGRYEMLVTPYILLGPKIDFEVKRSIQNDDVSNYEKFSKIRYGIKSGAGVEYSGFLFEVLFDLDLDSIYNDSSLEISTKSYVFNIGIVF